MGFEKVRVWVATGTQPHGSERYVAVFNLDDHVTSVEATWQQLGLGSGKLGARDVWNGQRRADSDRLKVELPAHGCVLYALHAPAR